MRQNKLRPRPSMPLRRDRLPKAIRDSKRLYAGLRPIRARSGRRPQIAEVISRARSHARKSARVAITLALILAFAVPMIAAAEAPIPYDPDIAAQPLEDGLPEDTQSGAQVPDSGPPDASLPDAEQSGEPAPDGAEPGAEESGEPEPGDITISPAGIEPFGASEEIPSLSLTANPGIIQTFVDPATGLQPTELAISIAIQISETYVSGGRIELPLDYIPTLTDYPGFTYGVDSFGTMAPFFNLVTPEPPAPGSVVSGYDTSNPDILVINLKSSTDPGFTAGAETINVYFRFNTDWNQKIPKGMDFWTVTAKAYVGAEEAVSAAPVVISAKTNAADFIFQLFFMAPSDADFYQGGDIQIRNYYYNSYYYENLFDNRATNILYLDVPTGVTLNQASIDYFTGTQLVGPAADPVIGTVPSGFTRYWRAVKDDYGGPVTAGGTELFTNNDWNQWQYNNYYTVRQHFNPITFSNIPAYLDGQTFEIVFGALYTRMNDVRKENREVVTYTKVSELPWALDIRDIHATNVAASPVHVCGIENGDIGNDNERAQLRLFGQSNYGQSTKNEGSQPITGVSFEMYQNSGIDTSPKVNFYQIAVYVTKFSASDEYGIYDVVFDIKDAISGAIRQTAAQRITAKNAGYYTYFRYNITGNGLDAPTSNTTFPLPALTASEYIDKVTVTPMGSAGDVQEGVFLPKNGVFIIYNARAWDDKTWPDGTEVPLYSVVSMGGRMTYDDNPEKPDPYPAGYAASPMTDVWEFPKANVYYSSAPYAVASLLSSGAAGRQPGDTVDYQVTGYNNALYSPFGWVDPRISFRVPGYIELASLEGAAAGATTILLLTDVSGTASNGTTAPVFVTFLGRRQTSGVWWNYYSFQVTGYTAPAVSGAPVFTIPVQFKINDDTPPDTYVIGPALVSSLNAKNFRETVLTLNGNVSGLGAANTGPYYGFEPDDNWYVVGTTGSAASTQLVVLPRVSLGVSSSVKSSQTGGVFIKSSVVPADKGEEVQMKLSIINDGNAAFTNIRLYDILPYSGDAFGSSGTITFVSATTGAGSPVIRYSKAAPGIANVPFYGDHGGGTLDLQTSTFQTTTDWSATAPATITDTTAIFVDFGSYQLAAGASVDIILTFSIPPLADQTACNQFFYSGAPVGGVGLNLNMYSLVSGFSTRAMMLKYESALPLTYNEGDIAGMPDDKSAIFDAGGDGNDLRSLLVDPGPSLSGYSFTAWKNTSSTNGIPGKEYAPNESYSFSEPGAAGLEAQWTPNILSIIYDLNDASGHSYASLAQETGSGSAEFGGSIRNPGVPTRAGYVFEGWFDTLEKANTPTLYNSWLFYGSSTPDVVKAPFSGAKTLYAGWTLKKVSITLEKNAADATNGTVTAITGKTYGDALGSDLPAAPPRIPARTGFELLGWATTPGAGTVNFGSATPLIDANGVDPALTPATLTLYAVWKAREVAITLVENGAGVVMFSGSAIGGKEYGDPIGAELPAPMTEFAPTRIGYIFNGWATTANAPGSNFTGGTALTAANGVQNADVMPTLMLYAIWTPINGIGLSFDKNHNDDNAAKPWTDVTPAGKTVTYDAAIGAIPGVNGVFGAPNRTGYSFNGWSTASGAGNSPNFFNTTIVKFTAATTVFAVWNPLNYTLTFDKNDGTGETDVRSGLIVEDVVYFPDGWTHARGDSMTLLGFAREPDATTPEFNGSALTIGDAPTTISNLFGDYGGTGLTLYAVWQGFDSYTLTYDANGGSGNVPQITGGYAAGARVTLVSTWDRLKRTGYAFAGWSTISGDNNDAGRVTAATFGAGNITVYAIWKLKDYTIDFDPNGGTTPDEASWTWTGKLGDYVKFPD